MESTEFSLTYLTFLGGILTVIGTVIVAWIRSRRSPDESIAIKSQSIMDLTDSVIRLTDALGKEQESRRRDRDRYEKEIEELKAKIAELENLVKDCKENDTTT